MTLLRRVLDNEQNLQGWLFQCTGCGEPHLVLKSKWTLVPDTFTKPTITPDLLYQWADGERDTQGRTEGLRRCHVVVNKGRLLFHADSTHAFAGSSQPMKAWDDTSDMVMG